MTENEEWMCAIRWCERMAIKGRIFCKQHMIAFQTDFGKHKKFDPYNPLYPCPVCHTLIGNYRKFPDDHELKKEN